MNKHCKWIALTGLMAILFVPSISYAQNKGQIIKTGGKYIRSLFSSGGKEVVPSSLKDLRINLENYVKKAALAPGVSPIQYVPREGVEIIDLNSRRHMKVLTSFFDNDLSGVTPDDIGYVGLAHSTPAELREPLVVFALNHGAHKIDLLEYALWNRSKFASGESAAEVLVRDYGLNPNGLTSNGNPILYEIMSRGEGLAWEDVTLSGIDVNVKVDGEPLIFRTQWKDDFYKLFAMTEDPWKVTNGMGADPVHMASSSFILEKVMPKGFQIPKENINKPDNFGNTYAHYAADGKYPAENLQYLREQGADLTRPNHQGETPLGILGKRMGRLAGLADPSSLGRAVDQAVAPGRGPTPRWD